MPARQPRAENRALKPIASEPLTPEEREVRNVLAAAGIAIGAWRWRLAAAGYPFREPPGLDHLIGRIDAVLYPEESKRS